MIRNPTAATVYSISLGVGGIIALALLTPVQTAVANAIPLAFFAALSIIVKRAGFHVAPEVTHSLVGIVDLASVFVFGPVLGAWVAASSGFAYLFLTAVRRDRYDVEDLLVTPLFNAGLKIGMAFASTRVYMWLGGTFAPRGFTPPMILPVAGALLAWFALDHIGWGLLELLQAGLSGLGRFFRRIVRYSLLMELLPLPFAIVIAVVYTSLDGLLFLIMALGLVGTAIVVQRLADASAHLERRRNELAILNEFSQALSLAGFDVDKVVDLLYQHARRLVPADFYRIELHESGQEPNESRLVLENAGEEVRHPSASQTRSPFMEYFSKQRDAIRIVDSATEAMDFGAQIDGRKPESALIVPLAAGDELIGSVALFALRPRAFSVNQERNLTSMCGQAALAIQDARLYVAERKRAGQLATVSDVSRQVAAVLDLDDLLQQVVNRIRERFGYSSVHVFTVEPDSGYVLFRASTDPHGVGWRERGVRLRIGLEGIVGWVAAMGQPLLVDDIRKEPRFIMDPDKALQDTRSELAVPLVVGNQIVGVLDVQSDLLEAFGEDDLFVLSTLSAQVAIAIEDARLFNSQREEAWYLNVLLQVAQNLSAMTDLDDALETVVRITPLLVGVERCVVFLHRPAEGVFSFAKAYGMSKPQEEGLRGMELRSDDEYALARVWREREPIVVSGPDLAFLVREEVRELLKVQSLLVAPLMTRGEVVGAMVVDQGTRPRQFSRHEIDVIMGIANQAAVAIEGARLLRESEEKKRLDYELHLARQIQESFLPEACPVLPGYQVCSMWQTARQVSGDFYDFVPLGGGRWGITIADVSDKGMAAALFMALSRTILRTMAIGKPTPHEAVDRANDIILADAHSDMFVTVFYMALDPQTGHITYVNAGHNPPLLYRGATQEVVPLSEHGIALGVVPNITLEDHDLVIEPGDVLLMYTDGVTETMNAQEEEFGPERLTETLVRCAGLTTEGLLAEITRNVKEFAGDGAAADDLTMIALKRLAE